MAAKTEIYSVRLSTKWLVVISMLAGVGMNNIEVSKWYLALVKTVESLCEAVYGTISLITTITGSLTAWQLVLTLLALMVITVMTMYVIGRFLR